MSTIPTPAGEIEPKPWQTGLAPVAIGLFLWVAFFDQIGRKSLPLGGIGGAFLGAMIGGPLAYLCLFRSSALWGFRSKQGLDSLASATFGVVGSKVVPGLLIAIAQVILFAVAVGYAIDLTFQGLALGGLIDPQVIRPTRIGGAVLKPPLVLATSLFWAVATALVSLKFTRWIGYLMQFFPIFPALILGGAMLYTLTGLPTFRPVDPPAADAIQQSFLISLQWVFAFASLACVMGADWGPGSLTIRDVRLGGWVGMAFAPAIVAIVALISIAGSEGLKKRGVPTFDPRGQLPRISIPDPVLSPAAEAPPYTFRSVMTGAFPDRVGATMLLIFGLGSLAPAVYASFSFGLRLKALGPGISRLTWTIMGTLTAWLLMIGGWFDRTEVAFNLIGAAFAPVAGALAADYRRTKGQWPGPRNGINPAGVLAWVVGLGVGLIPTIGQALGDRRLAEFSPAALAAFVVAYLTYEILGMIRFESGLVPISGPTEAT